MKRNELQKCAVCGKGVIHTGLPLFWKLSIERFGVDIGAVQRRHGLETFFGGGGAGAAMAGIMGADEDIAVSLGDKKTLLVCEDCAMKDTMVAALAEMEEVPA